LDNSWNEKFRDDKDSKNINLMAFANEHREQHPKKIVLNVGSSAFSQIQAGTKTMEMRLKKDTAIKISPGDIIIFQLQTGEEKKAGDEITCEKAVVDVRVRKGIDAVVENEPVGLILPTKPNKKDFKEKSLLHYSKAAKGVDIHVAEFEIIELKP